MIQLMVLLKVENIADVKHVTGKNIMTKEIKPYTQKPEIEEK